MFCRTRAFFSTAAVHRAARATPEDSLPGILGDTRKLTREPLDDYGNGADNLMQSYLSHFLLGRGLVLGRNLEQKDYRWMFPNPITNANTNSYCTGGCLLTTTDALLKTSP